MKYFRKIVVSVVLAFGVILPASGDDDDGFINGAALTPSNGLLTSLVSYWELNEASGSGTDAHASNTLADNNSDIGQDTTNKILGAGARAITASAASSTRLTVADPVAISSAWTFSGWFRPTTLDGGFRVGVAQFNSGTSNRGFQVYFETNTITLIGSPSGTSTGQWTLASGTNPDVDTWYHVVCGWDGADAWIQVNNGTRQTTTNTFFNSAAVFSLFSTANAASGAVVFLGQVDECAIWSRSLSTGDVSTLYNSGAGLAYSSFN